MAVKRRRHDAKASGPSGNLALLVSAEERLAARLREAQAEAARIVAEARARRDRAEAGAEATIAEATRALEAAAARERARRLAAIAADAERGAERYDRVSDEEVTGLATRTLGRLLDDEGRP